MRLNYDVDGVVREPRQAGLDPFPRDDRADLADPLPDHHRFLRLRLRECRARPRPGPRRAAVRDQPRRQLAVHADLRRPPQSAARRRRHTRRLGDHPLDHGRLVEPLPLGLPGANPLLRLGLARDRHPTLYYRVELRACLTPPNLALRPPPDSFRNKTQKARNAVARFPLTWAMGTNVATRELWEQARAGDRAAYDRLFALHSDRALLFIRARLGPALRTKVESV